MAKQQPRQSAGDEDRAPASGPPAGTDRQHRVMSQDGTVRYMSDDEWLARDPAEGLARVNDDDMPLEDDEVDTRREPGTKTRDDLKD